MFESLKNLFGGNNGQLAETIKSGAFLVDVRQLIVYFSQYLINFASKNKTKLTRSTIDRTHNTVPQTSIRFLWITREYTTARCTIEWTFFNKKKEK